MLKQCGKCEQLLPLEAYTRNSYSRDGLNNWCEECRRAQARLRYAKKQAAKGKTVKAQTVLKNTLKPVEDSANGNPGIEGLTVEGTFRKTED